MEKRLIGIDIDGSTLRVAIARPDKEGATVTAVGKTRLQNPEDLGKALTALTGGMRLYGDRLAAALPASAAFYRRLDFPFNDPKKIAAAGQLALATQLPAGVGNCVLALQSPTSNEHNGYSCTLAAVPVARVADVLTPFDEAAIPLHLLDVLPLAAACGLAERHPQGLLLILRDEETVLCRLVRGQLADCRVLPVAPRDDASSVAEQLLREYHVMRARGGDAEQPLTAIGPGATPALLAELKSRGAPLARLDMTCDDRPLAAEYLPAAILALRAGRADRQKWCNLRRDDFALRGEWAAMKKQLLGGGLLLATILLLLSASAWLGYAHKSGQAKALRQQMETVFRQTLADARPGREPYRQMRGRLNALRQEGAWLGLQSNHSALQVLGEISRATAPNLRLDVREFRYAPHEVRLDGHVDSFDTVQQLTRLLEQCALFEQAQVSDAKMDPDGNGVHFRLLLTLAQGEPS
jgi:general secretion pathway protein L